MLQPFSFHQIPYIPQLLSRLLGFRIWKSQVGGSNSWWLFLGFNWNMGSQLLSIWRVCAHWFSFQGKSFILPFSFLFFFKKIALLNLGFLRINPFNGYLSFAGIIYGYLGVKRASQTERGEFNLRCQVQLYKTQRLATGKLNEQASPAFARAGEVLCQEIKQNKPGCFTKSRAPLSPPVNVSMRKMRPSSTPRHVK